jgi:hypothetical protein
MKENFFYDADALSDGQEIPRFECNPKVTPSSMPGTLKQSVSWRFLD